jgi:hypothetical protein
MLFFLSICLTLCLSFCRCACCLTICLHAAILSVFLPTIVCLPFCMPIILYICLSLPACLSICLFLCLNAFLSLRLSSSLPVCLLPYYMSVCLLQSCQSDYQLLCLLIILYICLSMCTHVCDICSMHSSLCASVGLFFKSSSFTVPVCPYMSSQFIHPSVQGRLTEREGSERLTSSLS